MNLNNVSHIAALAIAGTVIIAGDRLSWSSPDRSEEVTTLFKAETIYRPACVADYGDVQFKLCEFRGTSDLR